MELNVISLTETLIKGRMHLFLRLCNGTDKKYLIRSRWIGFFSDQSTLPLNLRELTFLYLVDTIV